MKRLNFVFLLTILLALSGFKGYFSNHDFPPAVRLEAYQFIDKILKHTPNEQEIK